MNFFHLERFINVLWLLCNLEDYPSDARPFLNNLGLVLFKNWAIWKSLQLSWQLVWSLLFILISRFTWLLLCKHSEGLLSVHLWSQVDTDEMSCYKQKGQRIFCLSSEPDLSLYPIIQFSILRFVLIPGIFNTSYPWLFILLLKFV